MTGLTQQARLVALSDRLSERDRAVVRDVVRLRFVTGGQIERLHFGSIAHPITRSRQTQRSLAALVQRGILSRLKRRLGGVRAGSTSYVYGPTGEAQRLVAQWSGLGIPRRRTAPEPGTTFVDHTVACTEVYVRLRQAELAGDLELLEHQPEPDAWRQFPGPIGSYVNLRPDGFASVAVGDFEQRSFIEVDRGTEGRQALATKLNTYLAYWRSGREQAEHEVFPQVVWLVSTGADTDDKRQAVLRELIARLPSDTQPLFRVGAAEEADELLRPSGSAA